MTLEKVIERLEILFPIEMQNRTATVPIANTIDIQAGKLKITLRANLNNEERPIFNTEYNYEDLLKQEPILRFVIYHEYAKAMFYMNIEQLFEDAIFEFFVFSEDYFDECKDFVAAHPAFPKKVYYNKNLKLYTFVELNTGETVEIDDITEYSIVHTVQFVRNK